MRVFSSSLFSLLDQLIDERESLQIEISNAQAEGAKRDRESIKVRLEWN